MPLNALLAGYLSGVSTLASFLALPDDVVFARPAPGAWSASEVIHHLADSEVSWSWLYREVLVLPEPPAVPDWDAVAFGSALHYQQRPLLHSVGTITALRHVNVDLFSALAPPQWGLTAVDAGHGPMTLRDLVLMATAQFEERLAQARRAVNGST